MNENQSISPEQIYEAVFQLQTYLDQLAFFEPRYPFIAVNGIFDESTRQALEVFQELNRLPRTGRADARTWARLYEEYERSRATHSRPAAITPFPRIEGYSILLGEESELVGVLHHMLRTLRLVHDDLGELPDGMLYDARTENAVRIYQAKNDLTQSGRVDLPTWNTLAREYNLLVPRDA